MQIIMGHYIPSFNHAFKETVKARARRKLSKWDPVRWWLSTTVKGFDFLFYQNERVSTSRHKESVHSSKHVHIIYVKAWFALAAIIWTLNLCFGKSKTKGKHQNNNFWKLLALLWSSHYLLFFFVMSQFVRLVWSRILEDLDPIIYHLEWWVLSCSNLSMNPLIYQDLNA